jgi:hypothetical protein
MSAPINDVLREAMDQLHAKMDVIGRTHPLDQTESYKVDTDTGLIYFNWKDRDSASAPFQLIGIAQLEDQSRLDVLHYRWAWDDGSVPAHLKGASEAVRAFGQRRNLAEFNQSGAVRVHTDRAWSYLALAAALSEAHGATRIRWHDKKEAFLTFGPIS